MKKTNKILSILTFIPCLLCGCNNGVSSSIVDTSISYLTSDDNGTATIKIYKDNNSTSKERYIAPKNVE